MLMEIPKRGTVPNGRVQNSFAILDFHLTGRSSQPPSESAKEIESLLRRPVADLLGILNVRRKDLASRKLMIDRTAERMHLLGAYSVEAIALMTGISKGTVTNIRLKAGLTDRKAELGKFTWMEDAVEILASLLKGETTIQIKLRLKKEKQNVHSIKVNAIAAGFKLDPLKLITAKPTGNNNLMKALYLLSKGKDPDYIAAKLKVCKLGVQVLESIAKRKKLFALKSNNKKPRCRTTTKKG